MLTPKERRLTHKTQAVIEGVLKGIPQTEIGMTVFNTQNPINASNIVGRVLARERVKNEIERRLLAQEIYVDRHLKNIDKLAFGARKEDVRLRASQDIADRAGAHYKYFAEEGKVNLDVELTDSQFNAILAKHVTAQ